jgi:hypothetical protein
MALFLIYFQFAQRYVIFCTIFKIKISGIKAFFGIDIGFQIEKKVKIKVFLFNKIYFDFLFWKTILQTFKTKDKNKTKVGIN